MEITCCPLNHETGSFTFSLQSRGVLVRLIEHRCRFEAVSLNETLYF